MITLYTYKNCSTCKKATTYLESKGIEYDEIAIRETPPSVEELKHVLEKGRYEIKKLFNVSGQDYRALNMKEKLPCMTKDEALALLASNGNLIKRPFVVTDEAGFVGFKEAEWGALS